MHKDKRAEKIHGRGGTDKTMVIGVLQRGGEVRAEVIEGRDRETLQGFVRANVAEGSAVHTDTLGSYSGLSDTYTHETVNHMEEYVRGQVYTNGIENFWSLLKRGLHGTYISVEPYHLFRYLDERMYAFNNRDASDLGRFADVLSATSGRRLTWLEVTSKLSDEPSCP
jgi:hypothetical protein